MRAASLLLLAAPLASAFLAPAPLPAASSAVRARGGVEMMAERSKSLPFLMRPPAVSAVPSGLAPEKGTTHPRGPKGVAGGSCLAVALLLLVLLLGLAMVVAWNAWSCPGVARARWTPFLGLIWVLSGRAERVCRSSSDDVRRCSCG